MGFISTSLSVRQILENSNNVQTAAQSGTIQEEISISSANVIKFLEPSQEIDQLALNVLTIINQKQSDIISLGGNVGLGSTCYSSSTAIVTTLYGSLVTGIAVTYAEDIGINTVTSGIGSTDLVAYGVLRYDTLQAFRYPNMEPATLNSSTDNPLSGGGYVTLTSGNLGIGKETLYSVGAGASAIVFALQGTGCAAYAGIAASISSIRSEYNTFSAGIATHISNVNIIKGAKNSAQFEYWSLNKTNNNMGVDISANSSVLSVLSNIGY